MLTLIKTRAFNIENDKSQGYLSLQGLLQNAVQESLMIIIWQQNLERDSGKMLINQAEDSVNRNT